MSYIPSETVKLTQELIREQSITPVDANCQQIISERLKQAGFTVESIPSGRVNNIWAYHGTGKPIFAFAGHTDVVPTGNLSQWNHPPFSAEITDDGMLHGRGAQDMKGAVAAMVTACERFVKNNPNHLGKIGLLITSAEEGLDYLDGTPKVLEHLKKQNETIDWCLIGEPSCDKQFGDTIRNGRRGSFKAFLKINGSQGHVAYPELADNPIHKAANFIYEMTSTTWCHGNKFFPPTVMQCANLTSSTQTINIIPGELDIWFAYRFSSETTAEELQTKTEAMLSKHKLDYSVKWELSGNPFLTTESPLIDATIKAIKDKTNIEPQLSTGGGTSDGRFIAPTGAHVIEFGTRNNTIHKINEAVSCQELDDLSEIYELVLAELF